MSRLALALALSLCLAGCGAQPQPAPVPTTAPVVVVVTATPAPTVAITINTPIGTSVTSARATTPEEDAWMVSLNKAGDAFDRALEAGKGYLASPPTTTQADWMEARATFAQAVSDYKRTPVPPSLVKADYLVTEWFRETNAAFSDVEYGVQTGSNSAMSSAVRHFSNGKALAKKAASALSEASSSPSP